MAEPCLIEEKLIELQERIGVSFADATHLREALTHKSYINELPSLGLADNQRLEFLGDAILDFLVGEWLFQRYPTAHEGELTSLRAHIVRTPSLAQLASEFHLGSYLCLGKGESSSGGRRRPANLCAAFEALVGAMYLDHGLEVTRTWVHRVLARHVQEIDSRRAAKDPKSLLQEYTQGELRITPSYRIVREAGPDHARTFTAQALVDETVWGEGLGQSKQDAEQAAARAALLGRLPPETQSD